MLTSFITDVFQSLFSVTCFYCGHYLRPRPKDSHAFQCPACTCWNRYNAKGEIVADDPAMYLEQLNQSSYKRGVTFSESRLSEGKERFCHSCQTNQTLYINLLSDYLPSENDAVYYTRLRHLSSYAASLRARYPLVCQKCWPSVETVIRKRDDMALKTAFSNSLKFSKGKNKSGFPTNPSFAMEYAWAASSLTSIIMYTDDLYNKLFSSAFRSLCLFSCTLAPVLFAGRESNHTYFKWNEHSWLLWTLSLCVRLGTAVSIFLQSLDGRSLPPFLRELRNGYEKLKNTIFCVTITVECVSTTWLLFTSTKRSSSTSRRIRLKLNTKSDKTTTQFSSALNPEADEASRLLSEQSIFSALSLSSEPTLHKDTVKVDPSKHNSSQQNVVYEAVDEMDWEPLTTHSSDSETGKLGRSGDNIWLGPQRFFPPENLTGLEIQLMKTGLSDDNNSFLSPTLVATDSKEGKHLYRWHIIYFISASCTAGLFLCLWYRQSSYIT